MIGSDLLASGELRREVAVELEELAGDLVRAGYLRGDFLLTGGQRSDYYFDKYLFVTRPSILRRLARFLAELVPPGTDRVAGTELGGLVLAAAVSLELGLPMVIVKKDVNPYGGARATVGDMHPGERVTLIDDVVTTGTQIVRSARKLQDSGATVNSVVVVVDREEGGDARVAEAGLRYHALFRKRDLALG